MWLYKDDAATDDDNEQNDNISRPKKAASAEELGNMIGSVGNFLKKIGKMIFHWKNKKSRIPQLYCYNCPPPPFPLFEKILNWGWGQLC